MNLFKFNMFFVVFSIGLNASNSSDMNDDSKSVDDKSKLGRVSPCGLIPVLQLSRHIEQSENKLLALERKLSKKKLSGFTVIPVVAALENSLSKKDEKAEENAPILAYFEEENTPVLGCCEEENRIAFKKLCKKISSISLQLKNQENKTDGYLSKEEQSVGTLFERLASLKREHHLPVEEVRFFGSSLDAENEHNLLKNEGMIQQLNELAAKKESGINLLRDNNSVLINGALFDSISTNEAALGDSKKSSLRLEIPKALSFKHVQRTNLHEKKETKRQSIFGEAVSSNEGSDEEQEEKEEKH